MPREERRKEKEQEIWRTQTNLWWFFLFLSSLFLFWLGWSQRPDGKTLSTFPSLISTGFFFDPFFCQYITKLIISYFLQIHFIFFNITYLIIGNVLSASESKRVLHLLPSFYYILFPWSQNVKYKSYFIFGWIFISNTNIF